MKETRSFQGELRAEKDHGKTYLVGRAASYGVLSQDMGFFETLAPHCFDKALAAGTDIVHNLNHNCDLILGRTATGSTVLTSKPDGLYYKTLLPQTSYVRDLMVLMERGDFNSSSFCFEVGADTWDTMPDPENPKKQVILRTITEIKRLWDVSTTWAGAYPETSAQLSDRVLPASMPAEYRAMLGQDVKSTVQTHRAADDDTATDDTQCNCTCAECLAGDCQNCSNENCQDEVCLAVLRVRMYELDMRLKAHGTTAPVIDDSADRAARGRRVKLAMASW